jgi:hypothetical protein
MWNSIRSNAKARSIFVGLTVGQAWAQFVRQGHRCALSNTPLVIAPKTSSFGSKSGTTASLDRIDNAKGYTPENVQWVHKVINQMKGVFTASRFQEICASVSDWSTQEWIPLDYLPVITITNRNWKGHGGISGYLWGQIQGKALARQLEMGISIQDAWDLFSRQQGRCALTGWPLNLETHKGKMSDRTASLDRVDNTKGYIPGNIQWVHKDINRMKYTYGMADFVAWCQRVAQHGRAPCMPFP